MPKFKIYAGLSGGFGGASFQGVVTCNTYDEAMAEARQMAVEEYQSYQGYHGIRDYDDIVQEMIDDGIDIEDIDESDVELEMEEEMDSWIDYYVVEVSDDYVLDEDEE